VGEAETPYGICETKPPALTQPLVGFKEEASALVIILELKSMIHSSEPPERVCPEAVWEKRPWS